VPELDTELSCFDKIIQGDRKDIKVLHEDDKCIAFEDAKPVAKKHFIVLAKDPKAQANKDEATLGHMMVIAAKVAKTQEMAEGYRVVLNHGKNSF
jgi:histidine triad (HIT) family protein